MYSDGVSELNKNSTVKKIHENFSPDFVGM